MKLREQLLTAAAIPTVIFGSIANFYQIPQHDKASIDLNPREANQITLQVEASEGNNTNACDTLQNMISQIRTDKDGNPIKIRSECTTTEAPKTTIYRQMLEDLSSQQVRLGSGTNKVSIKVPNSKLGTMADIVGLVKGSKDSKGNQFTVGSTAKELGNKPF